MPLAAGPGRGFRLARSGRELGVVIVKAAACNWKPLLTLQTYLFLWGDGRFEAAGLGREGARDLDGGNGVGGGHTSGSSSLPEPPPP